MAQYTLSGLGLLGALGSLGEAISLSGSDLMPGDSQVVTKFKSDNVVADWNVSRVRSALAGKGLEYKSWSRSGENPAWHTVKVALENPMYASQVQARIGEVFQAQGGRGARAFSSNSPYGTRPTSGPHSGGGSSGGGGGGGGVATSDACRARGGVCRDVGASGSVGPNEEVVRGLCVGPANIVCVIPRRSGGGGGAGGGGGGGAPPSDTVVDRGGAPFDYGKAVLIGGAALFALAIIVTLVKRKSASSSMRRAAAATPVKVLPSPRMANRRRRNRRQVWA